MNYFDININILWLNILILWVSCPVLYVPIIICTVMFFCKILFSVIDVQCPQSTKGDGCLTHMLMHIFHDPRLSRIAYLSDKFVH